MAVKFLKNGAPAKPKKPRRPTKPIKPDKKIKHDYKCIGSFYVEDDLLIDIPIAKQSNNIKLYIEADYGSGDNYNILYNIEIRDYTPWEEDVDTDIYNLLLERYNSDIKKYKKNKVLYDQKYNDYLEQKQVYEKYQEEKLISDKRKQLEKLKKELGEK